MHLSCGAGASLSRSAFASTRGLDPVQTGTVAGDPHRRAFHLVSSSRCRQPAAYLAAEGY